MEAIAVTSSSVHCIQFSSWSIKSTWRMHVGKALETTFVRRWFHRYSLLSRRPPSRRKHRLLLLPRWFVPCVSDAQPYTTLTSGVVDLKTGGQEVAIIWQTRRAKIIFDRLDYGYKNYDFFANSPKRVFSAPNVVFWMTIFRLTKIKEGKLLFSSFCFLLPRHHWLEGIVVASAAAQLQ